uniref:non-specific serine/threonine protein kinase n=1 Tax=Poecilia mexicana TaxID=48701 RepID=A0A3B3WTE0_9TELE
LGRGQWQVAVKVIDKRKAKKDSYVTKNLRREGLIQEMIRHPNIAQLLDILETENSYYLVMELCPGGNLMNHIYEKKHLDERETQKYIRQLVLAVEHLHRAGVVHRDLKIENLLLDEQDNIKLIDFGLSNCAGILGYSDPFSTQCGSPAYAAPELLSRKKYGPKVDVWSIGVNMYAMLTGSLPFTVEPFSLRALHQKMVDKEMNPLPPTLSTAAICLLKKLLEPDPHRRPNIHQVMTDSWLQLANRNTGPPCSMTCHYNFSVSTLCSLSVLLHMTEKMGYKHSEVLSAVLTNRACHTLAVYFLLNKKMKRLSKDTDEVKTESGSSLRWLSACCHINEMTYYLDTQVINLTLCVAPGVLFLLFTCLYSTYRKKKRLYKKIPAMGTKGTPFLSSGILRALAVGHRKSPLAPPGTVASSSMEYLEIHPLFPNTPQQRRRLATLPPVNTSPEHNIPAPPAPSPIGMHSFGSLSKAEQIEDTPSTPWYKLTNGTLSPPRHVSAFQPDSSYLKKATIPSPPVLISNPQPKKNLSSDGCGSSDTSGSPSSSVGSPPGGSAFMPLKSAFSLINPNSAFSPPSNSASSDPESPTHRSKLPSVAKGLKKKVPLQPFTFRPEQFIEEVVSPPPYPMKTLMCASGALKTLC